MAIKKYIILTFGLSFCRLKDEKQVASIIDKVQEYLDRSGSVSELCRVYLRKIEHLYYKFDPNVLKQKEVSNIIILECFVDSSFILILFKLFRESFQQISSLLFK